MLADRDYHHHGRISAALLQAVLPLDDYEFYLCGPAAFMQSMYDLLKKLGVHDARIFAEEFEPAALQRVCDQATSQFELLAQADEAIVEFTESKIEQAWSIKNGKLLDFTEAHGLTPEFGCRSGRCGACKTELISGEVSYLTKPLSPFGPGEML
jgi:ferredoxin